MKNMLLAIMLLLVGSGCGASVRYDAKPWDLEKEIEYQPSEEYWLNGERTPDCFTITVKKNHGSDRVDDLSLGVFCKVLDD